VQLIDGLKLGTGERRCRSRVLISRLINLLKEAGPYGDLWVHRDIARRALEVGAILTGNDPEAIRYAVNGRYVGLVLLRQAGHTRLAAGRTPESLVPFVLHGAES
jgi:hypothetical protein